MKKYHITSYWQTETGRFNDDQGTFVDRRFSDIKEKEIYVEYDKETDVIHFRGGPTGYESYKFSSIEYSSKTFKFDKFCICSGTINSWPRCDIKVKDFMKIFNLIKKERNEKRENDY